MAASPDPLLDSWGRGPVSDRGFGFLFLGW
uniref:Uncharacterized protein n=1 Tax=Arundo donax TaxID=35708 RepID=A0A0A9BBC5_ARUDO